MSRKVGVSLNRDQVRGYVIAAADKLKEKVKAELKGKFVHLKFDSATRIRTNYLGVNVRYIGNNDKPVTRTLSVTDTRSQHTSRELKSLLLNILDDFAIPLDHVLCCVTDNAANMIKVVKDFNTELSEHAEDNIPSSGREESDTDESEFSDDEENDTDQDTNDTTDLFEQLQSTLPVGISHVRCGVHTLQLAIQDGLKTKSASAMIGKIRNIAVELRTPKLSEKLKKSGGKVAVLDQETRWGSTYLMVDRVLDSKTFINDSLDIFKQGLQLTAPQWRQAQELRDMLKKSFTVTKKMQLDDLTPGYFYRKWSGLRLLMEDHGGLIAREIFESMKKREQELLKNSLFLSAIFMDVCNMDLLSDQQKEVAKEAVVELVLKIQGLDSELDDSFGVDSPAAHTSTDDSDSDEEMRRVRKRSGQDTGAQDEDQELETALTTLGDDQNTDSLPPPHQQRAGSQKEERTDTSGQYLKSNVPVLVSPQSS